MKHEFRGPRSQGGWVLPAVAIGLSAASTAFGFGSAKKGAKAAKKAARKQAQMEYTATNYALKNLEEEEERLASTTVATAAGAGVSAVSGSPLEVLAEQSREFAEERAVTSRMGASRVQASLARGESLAKQYDAQALATAFTGLTQLAGMGYEYFGAKLNNPGTANRNLPMSPSNPKRRAAPAYGVGPQ